MQKEIKFTTGQESESKDPKLCDTIDQLRRFTCKGVKSTLGEYRKRNDQQRMLLNDKALRLASKGTVDGDMRVFIAVKHDEQGNPLYPFAAIKKGVAWNRIQLEQADLNKVGVYEVILYFVTNPDEAFYEKKETKTKQSRKIYLDKAQFYKDTHQTTLLLDHANLVAEYSDPHGHAPWNKAVYDALRLVIHKDIQLLPPWETCPSQGIQTVVKEGICGYFSAVYAFLRLRCPHVPPLELQTHLIGLGQRKIKQLVKGWACFLLSLE